jgi:DNA-binding transcriptional MerR regulator
MKQEKQKFTVGELARRCCVSVRTLQYYDSVGILAPKDYSEGGRRMYGRSDILRLQQILFFKSLGFSLEEIRDRLLPVDSSPELERLFAKQKEAISERIAHLQNAMSLLDKLTDEVKTQREISVENLFAFIGAIRMGNPYSFMVRHFSGSQLNHIFDQLGDDDIVAEFNKKSSDLTEKLLLLYRRHEDPESVEAQELAEKWWGLMMMITKGDPSLMQRVFAIGSDDDNWPAEEKELLAANKNLLGSALTVYLNKKGIGLPLVKGMKE